MDGRPTSAMGRWRVASSRAVTSSTVNARRRWRRSALRSALPMPSSGLRPMRPFFTAHVQNADSEIKYSFRVEAARFFSVSAVSSQRSTLSRVMCLIRLKRHSSIMQFSRMRRFTRYIFDTFHPRIRLRLRWSRYAATCLASGRSLCSATSCSSGVMMPVLIFSMSASLSAKNFSAACFSRQPVDSRRTTPSASR